MNLVRLREVVVDRTTEAGRYVRSNPALVSGLAGGLTGMCLILALWAWSGRSQTSSAGSAAPASSELVPVPAQRPSVTESLPLDPVPASPSPDQLAARPEEPTGLARAGYATHRCLICNSQRDLRAQTNYSDRRGFGLCADCGAGYVAWTRALQQLQAGMDIAPADQPYIESFKATMMRHFSRDQDAARRGIGMVFMSGQFATPEWNTLTGGQ
jgi:hypothetical protein